MEKKFEDLLKEAETTLLKGYLELREGRIPHDINTFLERIGFKCQVSGHERTFTREIQRAEIMVKDHIEYHSGERGGCARLEDQKTGQLKLLSYSIKSYPAKNQHVTANLWYSSVDLLRMELSPFLKIHEIGYLTRDSERNERFKIVLI